MSERLMKIPLRSTITGYRDTDDKKRKERGSITLEATIFLTMFIFFYLLLISLIQMTKAQVILQYAADQAAQGISAYSYALTKAGIVEKRAATSEKAAGFRGHITDVLDAVEQVENTLTTGGSVSDLVDAAEDAGQKAETLAGDLDELGENILSLVKSYGADVCSQAVIGEIAEPEVERQIAMLSGKDADQYLKDLGIADGTDGLDFSQSKWASESVDDMPVLEVAIVYEMEIKLGFIELEPRKFKVCAKTALW